MKSIFCLLAAGISLCCFAEVIPLPELDSVDSWTIDKPDRLSLGAAGNWLELKPHNLTEKDRIRLLLKKPILIPKGYELYWDGAIERTAGYFVKILVRDSKGGLYLFHQSSRSFCKNSMYLGAYFEGGMDRTGKVLFRGFGLKNYEKQSFSAIKPAGGSPKGDIVFIGIEISAEGAKSKNAALWFRNFRFSNQDHKNSELYYQFDKLEQYREVSGLPNLSYGQILSWKRDADQFKIDWSIRSEFAGQPFLAGNDELIIDKQKGAMPGEIQLTRTITFPVTTEGTYWVRVKYRTYRKNKLQNLAEKDFRLFVIKGDKTPLPTVISADADIGTSLIRIAPERKSMIWDEGESWILNTRFRKAEGTKCTVEVLDHSAQLLKKAELDSTKPEEIISLDLNELKSGALTVKAIQSKDGVVQDFSQVEIGKKEKSGQTGITGLFDSQKPFCLPDGVMNWKELISDTNLHWYLEPHISIHGPDDSKVIQKCMDVTSAISKDVEIQAGWSKMEPMPGVYDFRWLDAALDHAAAKGLKVQIDMNIGAPEWIPSHFTRNPEGKLFGHNTYLFHGARVNTYFSPVIRAASQKYIEAMVLHYRNHPALQSYYILIEHPNEAPYKNWFEGFDSFTLESFRKAMVRKYGSVDECNKVWKTDFKTAESIMPPLPYSKAANQRWLDWISFRKDAVTSYQKECIELIRKYDPERMIMMYGYYSPTPGVMGANGGCHFPNGSAFSAIASVENRVPQRSEEHSVTNWSAYFPTQVDTSCFAMMLGGGENSFLKMFFPARGDMNSDTLTKMRSSGPYSGFNRLEKFIPIWNELRQARSLAGDIRVYHNEDSGIVQRKSTFNGGTVWESTFLLDSQVPFWSAPSKDWKKSKLIFLSREVMYLTKDVLNDLADYVQNGGNLLMTANAGRYSIEDDDADWVLLKKAGITPPVKYYQYRTSELIGAGEWKQYGKFSTGGQALWIPAEKTGTVLAQQMIDKKLYPALTVSSYGKGRIFVLWCESIKLTDRPLERMPSFFRKIAEMCGSYVPIQTDSRLSWVNLLKHKDQNIWYFLVMRSSSGGGEITNDKVRVTLPDGQYEVTELVKESNKTTVRSAEDLKQNGFTTELKMREVLIYRLKKK